MREMECKWDSTVYSLVIVHTSDKYKKLIINQSFFLVKRAWTANIQARCSFSISITTTYQIKKKILPGLSELYYKNF